MWFVWDKNNTQIHLALPPQRASSQCLVGVVPATSRAWPATKSSKGSSKVANCSSSSTSSTSSTSTWPYFRNVHLHDCLVACVNLVLHRTFRLENALGTNLYKQNTPTRRTQISVAEWPSSRPPFFPLPFPPPFSTGQKLTHSQASCKGKRKWHAARSLKTAAMNHDSWYSLQNVSKRFKKNYFPLFWGLSSRFSCTMSASHFPCTLIVSSHPQSLTANSHILFATFPKLPVLFVLSSK